MASLRWGSTFLVVLIIFQCVCMMFYKQNTPSFGDVMTDTFQKMGCAKLRHKFSVIKPAKSIKFKSFAREVSDFLSCPYKSNETEQELNRIRLRFCCNATESFVLTKRNTAVNQSIPYETNSRRTYKMNADVHKLLPEDSPWSAGALGLCAVVGSSGILKNSSCGRQIDSADYVIRFNLALINDSDVGLKTNLITINPSQIRGYRNLEKKPGPLVKRVSVYGNSSLIIPAFAYVICTSPSLRVLRVLQPIRPQQPVLFFSPHYLRALDRFWKGRGLKERRLSTGFMLISAALEMCEHVHVYGFWPFGTDLQENPIPYHYYDQMRSGSVHRMPEEFLRLLQLHSQGALTLHLQPCDTH